MHLFIRELGKKFDSGSSGVIAENKEKYISFNINAIMGLYEDMWGKIKKKKFSLDSLTALGLWRVSWACSRNLVGVNGMMCTNCRSKAELKPH